MQITLPEHFEATLSPSSAAFHLAMGLFVSEKATLGQAAEVAGLNQLDFMRELAKRQIPLYYGVEEIAEDLKTIEAMGTQAKQ